MASTSPDLEALAESCLQSAKTIKSFLATQGSDRLAFDTQALSTFPKSDEATDRARSDLRNAAKTMYDLATGPEGCLMESSLTSVSSTGDCEDVGLGTICRLTICPMPAAMDQLHEIYLPFQDS